MRDIAVGSVGTTSGALRPFGKVIFDGEPVDATAEGQFVEDNAKVVVVQIKRHVVVVRPSDGQSVSARANGSNRNHERQPRVATSAAKAGVPLEQPLTWLERLPVAWIFACIGGALAIALLLGGRQTLNGSLLLLPLAGIFSAATFGYAVSLPRRIAGPYEDRRRETYAAGALLLAAMIVGICVGLLTAGTAITVTLGWCGGVLAGLALVVMHVGLV